MLLGQGMVYNQGGQLDLDIQRAILLDGGDIPAEIHEDHLIRATESASRTLGAEMGGVCAMLLQILVKDTFQVTVAIGDD